MNRAEHTLARLSERERWDRVNAAGSALFGVRWLAANEMAASLLDSFGLEPRRNRALGGAIALQIALAASHGKIPVLAQRRIEEIACRAAAKPELQAAGLAALNPQ
jgi:hypothetical protein